MRIVIDLQGAQTGSRFRGIGRYAISLTKAMIRRAEPGDEIVIALNGLLEDSIETLRAEFDGLLPQSSIHVWQTPGPIESYHDTKGDMRQIGEAMREHFLRSLEPDAILVTSVFEGLGDDALISIKKFVRDVPVACIFYDFTPLILPDEHFLDEFRFIGVGIAPASPTSAAATRCWRSPKAAGAS